MTFLGIYLYKYLLLLISCQDSFSFSKLNFLKYCFLFLPTHRNLIYTYHIDIKHYNGKRSHEDLFIEM